MYNYLKRHRNVERGDDDDDETDAAEAGLAITRKLRSRPHTVTIDAVDRLVEAEWVFIGTYGVEVGIRVTYIDYDTRITPMAFPSSGCCNCERERNKQRLRLTGTSASDIRTIQRRFRRRLYAYKTSTVSMSGASGLTPA